MAKTIYQDTSHSLPSRADDGRAELEQKISESVRDEHAGDEEKRQRKAEAERKLIGEEHDGAERALGEFLGYEMRPTRRAEFKGASRECSGCWIFRVGKLVFRLNRITTSSISWSEVKRGDFSFQVVTEFERVYGCRRLKREAKQSGADECHNYEWLSIEKLADIAQLRKDGKLEQR